ncbi:hypothetical protein [Actinopolymorpha pittospori]|uniref:Uncharacterized protein n=1 Tax=Actinopolymorpha pittospori TaxID=648752 RepID=A0A927RB73_9ACTN|nr:hypothetical protein [Actinopolymorpha pittospori]MBE1605790.1 hypothetical protein [Actinopolymorpha pittospori]
MAAFLVLPTGSGLTLADVEAWVSRARTLGASAVSQVRVGDSPLAAGHDGGMTLSVPVTASRRVLPETAGPYEASAGTGTGTDHDRVPETEADGDRVPESEADGERVPETEADSDRVSETEADAGSVADGAGHTAVEESPAPREAPALPRPPLPVFSHPS